MIRTNDGKQYKRIVGVGDRQPTTGFEKKRALFTATGGETSIDLALLSPPLAYMPGHNQIAVKRSSGGGSLIAGVDFTESSTTTIDFTGDPLVAGEIVEISQEVTVTGIAALAARPDAYTATATAAQTLITADFSWPYNLNAGKGIGAVEVFINGILQTRGVDLTEVDLSTANTNQVLLVDPLLGGENIILVPTYQVIDDAGASTTFNNGRWADLAVTPGTHIASADASKAGLVDTQAQTFAGVKTFTNGISLGNETLSVYDEGTWTPTVLAETGSITTYTSSGRYTKIGNTVHFWVSISIADKGTGSNSIRFNLPFTPAVESPLIGWSGATGYAYTGSVKTDASAAFRKYDWTNPLENYTYVMSGTFVVQGA